MLWLQCTIVLFLVTINRTFSFNIEERNPIVKRAKNSEKGSYFGFSVAQHKTHADNDDVKNNWILVGAPLGQNLQPETNRSGALFKCPITTNANDCLQVETDGRRFDEFDYSDTILEKGPVPLERPGGDEIKNGQWLGVSVKSHKPGGKVIVCAHRYIQSHNLQTHHYGLGLCYLLNKVLEVEESIEPCKGRLMERLHQQYGFCQVGTSVDILDDGYALMGSPGPYTWRGTVFAKEVEGTDYLDKDQTMYKGPLNDNSFPIDKYSYLGMSVAGGYFLNKHTLTYVAGAPRSQLFGQVFFFERRKFEEDVNITYILTGEQFASSFGYEVLVTDINKDGYDDLLVGAPFYYDGDKHGGAVYIYTNLKECIRTQKITCSPTILKGKPESRFGFSMTALGDINKDGYTDVAIGAPYEDDSGAIRIFLGSKDGLNPEPSQIIKSKHLKTLGYSLSGGLDMDNNDYPDLLVGAYESDMAILYKTRPVIDISITIRGTELNNINATKKGCVSDPTNTENTCFTFRSCFVISDVKSPSGFKVRYQMREVAKKISRIWFQNLKFPNKHDATSSRDIEVSDISREYCQSETVYIKEGIGDILTPIKFLVNYTLANNAVDSPILNKTSVKEFEATFQKSCGDDDVCESNLVLNVGSQLKRSEGSYVLDLGQNKEFILDANVTNFGEPAYEAKLFVVHPEALSYIALQIDKNKTSNLICTYENDTLVVCNLGNPFQQNQTVNLRLRFEIKNTKEQVLNLKVFVNSTSTELSKQTSQSLIAILQKIAEYTIEGKGTPHIFYSGEVKGQSAMEHFEDIGGRVYHTYELNNNGKWQIHDVEVRIRWPYQVRSGEENQEGKWLLYLENTPKIGGTLNYCYVEPLEAVNPLKLNSSGLVHDDPDNFTAPVSFTASPDHVRRRRDVDYKVEAENIKGPDGKMRKVVAMDCARGTARCVLIVCKIKQLSKNDFVKIQIASRIWNSTLVEDYTKVDWVSIKSEATVIIPDATIIHSNDSISYHYVLTVGYPEKVLADTGPGYWVIILAILAGLLLLFILIFVLYKVGFFKRNRVKDQTLSGNLKKQGESESLLKMNESKT